MSARTPKHKIPGHRPPGRSLPTSSAPHPIQLVKRLLRGLLLGLVALAALWTLASLANSLQSSSVASSPTVTYSNSSDSSGFSSLQNGYTGPPVVVDVEGARTRSLNGLCIAVVRDASSSVSSGIDQDGQMNKELAAVSEAFANRHLSTDRVVGVIFGDDASSSGLVSPGDPTIRQVLTSSPSNDGTNFTNALSTAATSLSSCPRSAAKHLILISDGQSSDIDISAGLQAIPTDTALHLVALDDGSWNGYAQLWADATSDVTTIKHIDGGVVAMTISRIMTDLTGQNFTTGFDINRTDT